MAPDAFVRVVVTVSLPAIDHGPLENCNLVREYGLLVSSFPGHETLDVGVNQREQHTRIEVGRRATIEQTVSIGCPTLVRFSGTAIGSAMLWRRTHHRRARLRDPRAETVGMTLILDLLTSKNGCFCDERLDRPPPITESTVCYSPERSALLRMR